MRWEHGWIVLFWSSNIIQVVGFAGALWHLIHSDTPGWRWFWLGFSINWIFTLAHQLAVGVFTREPYTDTVFLMGFMKLGAMVSELFIMLMARQLAFACAILHAPSLPTPPLEDTP